jgi:putative SOS response-associated peptidase YedK
MIMCGRFTMTRRDRSELATSLGIQESELGDYAPRYNIAPTQPYFVVTTEYENRKAIPASWGLVNSWATDARRASMCINAKAETIDSLPSFRGAFEKRRCVVPADGFYEWRGSKTMREPLWIHPADGGLLLFAGLYEAWQRAPGEWQTTFTIVTTAANRLLEPIHNRMPVILDEAAADDWMNPREHDPRSLKRLLVPAAADLLAVRPASPLVNSVKNEGPELLEDLSLFGE